MEVIARKRLAVAALVWLSAAVPAIADQSADVRSQVTYVASALASGNPTDALIPFDKQLPDYEKLSQYFGALTQSYDVVSEIEIKDEEDSEKESILRATWTLQLADKASTSDIRRAIDVTIHLKPVGNKWKIISFAPIELFNPQTPTAPNPPK